jgi:hypothetical protein
MVAQAQNFEVDQNLHWKHVVWSDDMNMRLWRTCCVRQGIRYPVEQVGTVPIFVSLSLSLISGVTFK